MKDESRIAGIIKSHEKEILSEWVKEQVAAVTHRGDLVRESDLREQSRAFLSAVQQATQIGGTENLDGPAWGDVKHMLAELSKARALAGFSPTETATFVFSLKQPLFARLRGELKAVAEKHAGGRMVSMLEGGYALSALGRSAVQHIKVMAGLA